MHAILPLIKNYYIYKDNNKYQWWNGTKVQYSFDILILEFFHFVLLRSVTAPHVRAKCFTPAVI